jgi:methionyl-tRNA formyltransferase
MKKRIYLFCNKEYGSAFINVFQMFAQEQADFECFIVFSLKGIQGGWIRRLARSIRQLIKHKKNNHGRTHNYIYDIKVLEIKNVNQPGFVETIPCGSIGFVAGFNQIFQKTIINRFSSFINFHPSLLPYYRGAIPSYFVIKNGETITGFTAQKIAEEVDAGDIIYQELVEVNQSITEAELDFKIAAVGSFYFNECLKTIKAGKPFRQNLVNVQYTHKVDYVSPIREE